MWRGKTSAWGVDGLRGTDASQPDLTLSEAVVTTGA